MKLVINICYGGFGLSDSASQLWATTTGKPIDEYSVPRHDPTLVHIVEALGQRANSDGAELLVVEIPDDRYFIREYDGWERVFTPSNIKKMWVIP